MRENRRVARFAPPTPRSRRLGRELRRIRERAGLSQEQLAERLGVSQALVGRRETGEIRASAGNVLEILRACNQDGMAEAEIEALLQMARAVREVGWWQRLGTLPPRYTTMIAYETEAQELHTWEQNLFHGLLQTEGYARAIVSIGRETETEAIEQRVRARLQRQAVLTRKENRLRLDAVISETALYAEVGGPETLREQLLHVVRLAKEPNITVQILRFRAGAHLASYGGFSVMRFESDPPLGYLETLLGELFAESNAEIDQLTNVFTHLKTLALSPAESARLLKERASVLSTELAEGQ